METIIANLYEAIDFRPFEELAATIVNNTLDTLTEQQTDTDAIVWSF
ncbi:MAG: hypothetical protein MJ197_10845 [Bacteroidales bacterium]|nr:hypothetical protein [Bacteroidales bacterium]